MRRVSTIVLILGAIMRATLVGAQQPSITRSVLRDGVELWQRGAASNQKPWFFELMQSTFDVVLPGRRELPFEKSIAFLVGVSKYDSLRPQLPFVKNDIDDLRSYLLSSGGFDAVYVVPSEVASPDLIESYLVGRLRRELNQRDRLLFYYAGHGGDLGGITGYMQFSKAGRDNFAHDVLAIDRVQEWSRVIKASHILFLFDACASGLAFTPTSRVTELDETRLAATLSGSGSRIVMTAGTADQETFEVGATAHGNGVFTKALLNALANAKEPLITANQLFSDIERQVAAFALAYHKVLTPRIWRIEDSPEYRGTFVFLTTSPQGQRLSSTTLQALNARSRHAQSVVEEAKTWPLIAFESFDSMSSAWRDRTDSGAWGRADRQTAGGSYRWRLATDAFQNAYSMASYEPRQDLYAAVDVKIVDEKGCCTAAGLMFRGSYYGDGYELKLNSKGFFALGLSRGENYRTLLDWTLVPGIDPKGGNRLSVRAVNDSMKVYVNGRLLGVISDATRMMGHVGLIAGADAGVRTTVLFDNFELRSPP